MGRFFELLAHKSLTICLLWVIVSMHQVEPLVESVKVGHVSGVVFYTVTIAAFIFFAGCEFTTAKRYRRLAKKAATS